MEWWVWITRCFLFCVDHVEYIIKKHETLTTIFPIHVYINRIKNRLVFKIKKWLILQTSETMKLFGRTKKSIDKT